MSAHRLQRYAIFLQGYNYRIEHVKGCNNLSADTLSRLPINGIKEKMTEEIDCELDLNFILGDIDSISLMDIQKEIQEDFVLKNVYNAILSGKWPDKKNVSEEVMPYFSRKNEFSLENGFIFWGHRVVIPKKFQNSLLNELHSTHLGIVKMKSIARSYVWWPGIDKDLELVTKQCVSCRENRDNPPQIKNTSWPVPKGPGERIHIDFLGPWNNMMFVVIIDAFSKFVYVKRMVNINTMSTIHVLREYFSNWGIPRILVSDNGTSLCSHEMENFLQKNGVKHICIAPFHPASNGAAENLVRTFKNFLKKSGCNIKTVDFDIQRFILAYNSTSHCSTKKSPAELHLGRPLYNALDRLKFFKDSSDDNDTSCYKNNNHCKVRSFKVGDTVLFKNYGQGPKWLSGKIVNKLSPVTYLVAKIGNLNNTCKRHVNQILFHLPDTNMNVPNTYSQVNSSVGSDPVRNHEPSSQLFNPPSPCINTRVRREIRVPQKLNL
uniref:RNA-directed DNA polymerase n=2 Tax=Cacopsylla melanoneura TaxID=428564 RepID=A0A8D8PMG0_9HEMI